MNKKCDGYIRPFRFQLLQSFPYIVEDFDQYTEYELFCKLVEKVNEVIGNENEITKEVNDIKEYLETLDLQDEVNNKLDEMAEDGTLQEIMAAYLNSKAIFGFDNVDAMKDATNLIDGSYAKTLGYYEKNDGGMATYKIRTITNDDVIDNISIIALNDNTNNLIAELIFDNNILNIKQAGAIGDGETDNTQIFTKSIAICKSKKLSLYIPIGKYNVNGTFNIDFSLKIYGEHVGNNVGTWGDQDSPSFRYASIINDVNTTQNNPEYYLFNVSTYNRGCVEFKDLLIEGNNCNHSAINLLYAGWTFYIENVTIDNFKYKGLNCLTLYDSNILNLTIERCGKAKFENVPQYAIYMSKNQASETNTNAIHFTMLHMEFCRYYINFNNAQDISFTNCKFEITDNNPNQEEIGHVDSDIDNPHFLINNNNDSRIIFTNTTFCFRGLYTWLVENPNVSDLSTLPYAFKTEGDGTNQMANISFVGCTIFSPYNDGGFKFIDNSGHCNIDINDCNILNLTPRASAFVGNKYIINNNRMTYFVHTSVNSFEGVGSNLTESIITNNNIFGYTSTMNKCSNNGVNGFIIINIDKNSIFDSNKITNFTNMPLIYFDETIKTFETTSGTTSSQTLTAPRSGKCIIKLHLTIPSGGNSGRLYVKLATNQRTANVNLLAFQSNIPNNSTNQDFYIIDNLRKGEELKLDILQDSGTNKTIYGTFTFNYS